MSSLITELFFFLESQEYGDHFFGFDKNSKAILTADKGQVYAMRMARYSYTGYKKFDIDDNEDALEVDTNNRVMKSKRGKTWAQSFGTKAFTVNGLLQINQGINLCMVGEGPSEAINKETCRGNKTDQFKIVFSKDDPYYLTPKGDQKLAVYMSSKSGEDVELRDLNQGTPLRLQLNKDRSAPIVMKANHAMSLTATDFTTAQSKLLDFQAVQLPQIVRFENLDGAYRIFVTDSKNTKKCLTSTGSYKRMMFQTCDNNNSNQLFETLTEAQKEDLSARGSSQESFILESLLFNTAVGVTSERNNSDFIASTKENGKILQYVSQLKGIFLGETNLAMTNVRQKAVLKVHTGTPNQKMQMVQEGNQGEFKIKTDNGALCLTYEGFENSPLAFEPCQENYNRQNFSRTLTSSLGMSEIQSIIPQNGGKLSAAIAKALENSQKSTGEDSRVKVFIYGKGRRLGLYAPEDGNKVVSMKTPRESKAWSYDPTKQTLHDVYHFGNVLANHFNSTSQGIMEEVNSSENQKMQFVPSGREHYLIKSRSKCLARLGVTVVKFVECTGGDEMVWEVDVLGQAGSPHTTPFTVSTKDNNVYSSNYTSSVST